MRKKQSLAALVAVAVILFLGVLVLGPVLFSHSHYSLEREYEEADQAQEIIGDVREGIREMRKKFQSPER